MKSFLEHVAADILAKHGTNLSQTVVIFPNKRAALFLNEHLARLADKPLWSPVYMTISDLFRSQSSRQVADPVKLVCDLHKSFIAMTGTDETLDHFYGWGQLLLEDFDNIDKQMADADRIFANLSDLHEMDDDSFLTEEQRQVLRRFFSNFSEEHNSELKQRFLRLWSRMADIYHDFNQRLAAQGLAYEGALYREVVESSLSCESSCVPSCVPSVASVLRPSAVASDQSLYLFVGFNALLQVEQRLFAILQKQGRARFYWDFDHYYLPLTPHPSPLTTHPSPLTPHHSPLTTHHSPLTTNEAGHFLKQYLSSFPNELDGSDASIYDCFAQPKHITIASASTENIQARFVTSWLKDAQRLADGRQTAIVLCNEALLPVVIHALPGEVEHVNVTTGYPLAQSPVASLINLLIDLRRDGYDHQRQHYRLRQVSALLRHPYLQDASPQVSPLLQQLKQDKNYFPLTEQLSVDELTTLLFRPFPPQHQNVELLTWLCEVMQHIATHPSPLTTHPSPFTPHQSQDILKAEGLFRAYTLLNRLLNLAQGGDLQTDIVTLGRLISQLTQATTIPFHGEPAEGLQVMGVLETRNLDFRHLLILSASEGNLPRGITDTSFIPYSLRKAYGLTTPEHKAAIYSYYFHRMLQRASDVTIVYNNSTADGQRGEPSRFLLQLMAESPHPLSFIALQGGLNFQQRRPQPVENRARLPELLTPTAINRYLRCPLQFHYYYVCNLSEPDETEDDTIDNRIFGNIFHEASRIIYTRLMEQSSQILAKDIDRLLKDRVDIERAVDEAFRRELFQIRDDSRPNFRPRINGLQLINRAVIIHYLRQLLTIDRRLTPFTILSLEGLVSARLRFPASQDGTEAAVIIGGRIDRLDRITDKEGREHIRVIDYKTGAHRQKPLPDVDAIFEQEYLKEHSDYYLQTMLYSLIVAGKNLGTPVSPALLFIQHAGVENYDPVLCFGKEPIADVAVHGSRFAQLLRQVIARMFDPSVPLEPTADRERCRTCPYRQLCL